MGGVGRGRRVYACLHVFEHKPEGLKREYNSLKRQKFLPTDYIVLLQRPMPICLADSKARRKGAWRGKKGSVISKVHSALGRGSFKLQSLLSSF